MGVGGSNPPGRTIKKTEKIGAYILQSFKNQRHYIGSANDMSRRLQEHNDGRVKSTRYSGPLELKLFFPSDGVTEAMKVEYKLKFKNREIIEKIIKEGKIKIRGG